MICPKCGQYVEQITQPRDSPLNKDQWDAVRCGDYYCDSCRRYYWLALVPSTKQSAYSTRTEVDHTRKG